MPDTLGTNIVPIYNTSDNPTGCCPRFNPTAWEDKRLHFENKLFVRAITRSVFHIPINIGRVFPNTMAAIEAAGAQDMDQVLVLSRDLSAWKGEHLFAVTKDVVDQEIVRLSGDFQTKVFEGPYREARHWYEELSMLGSSESEVDPNIYFYYTTCPKCAKQYGENYVVGIVSHSSSEENPEDD